MFQITYEYPETWPAEGPIQIDARLQGEIQVSPIVARRHANGYLTLEVGTLLGADEPVLVWGERPVWRLTVNLHLPHRGKVAAVGTLDVDATQGTVLPPSDEELQQMQERARDLALRFAPETATAI